MRQAKILIVEDERIIALDLTQRLKALGYEVVASVPSGEKALASHRSHAPDIVLMDIHLEGQMDGTEAARAIREQDGTPVVFLTAYAEDDTIERALQSNPYGYLVKPVDTKELHATLQTALSRRESERALAESERRLQLAVDVAELGIWEWEVGKDRFTADTRFGSILGQDPEALNENIDVFLDRLYVQDKEEARVLLQKAVAEGCPVDGCFRYQGGGGMTRWLDVHARIHQVNSNNHIVGVIKDVTDQRNIQIQLRQSAAVFETISEGLFTLDGQGMLLSANPAFLELTGYKLEEVLGRDPDEFLHARRHSDQFYQVLTAEKRGRWQGEIWCRRKGGEVFPVWETLSVVYDGSGGVANYVGAVTDITPLRRAEERINHLAYHDPLTGLPNRILFSDRLSHAIELASRDKTIFALLFLDLDGFKSINDTLGHSSGDLLLQTVASQIKSVVRSSDTVARVGGDEFVVLVTDLSRPELANLLADKLLATLSQPMELAGQRVSISTSIGIAIYPSDGGEQQELMAAADTAMYEAKSQGKNRACFYTQELAALAAERRVMVQGLKQAVANDEFILHYQPQFRTRDKSLVGIEALIRWNHPSRGLIGPGVFIPVAEEEGLIEQIGNWALQKACAQMSAWVAGGGRPIRLSVNVSVRQMRNGGIVDALQRTLSETGLAPELVEIEITESTLQVLEDSRVLLGRIRAMGVKVGIDDFGTGYSSLSVIKHLPIDHLKIDRSFIKDLPDDSHDAGIVDAIINMAKVLDIELTAEGVETEAQFQFLKQAQCDEVQGFLLGRPMPWEEVRAML